MRERNSIHGTRPPYFYQPSTLVLVEHPWIHPLIGIYLQHKHRGLSGRRMSNDIRLPMLELPPDSLRVAHVILKDVSFAEEALSLPAPERAGLARLLVESLEGDSRSDEDIRRDLLLRLQSLRTGADAGITFEQVFGEAL